MNEISNKREEKNFSLFFLLKLNNYFIILFIFVLSNKNWSSFTTTITISLNFFLLIYKR
jgi:hypothetical protein